MDCLTAKEIADDLGLGKATVLKYFREGFLPGAQVYINNTATYTISTPEFHKWKLKHFKGVKKGVISKYSDLEKELTIDEINSYIETWLEWCSNGLYSGKPLAIRTVELNKYYMDLYFKLLGKYPSKPLISIDNLRKVLGSLGVDRFGTKIKIFTSILSFTKYLVITGKLSQEEQAKYKELKPKRFLPAKKLSLDATQAQQLIDQVNKKPNYTAFDKSLAKAVIVFLLGTGLRNSELCKLKLDEVDFERSKVFVNLGKGNKNRVVGMTTEVQKVLIEYLKQRSIKFPNLNSNRFFINKNGNEFNINTLYTKINKMGKAAGLEINPHGLRRTFASINSAKGRPLNHLRIALGHADLTTTQGYLMTTENEVVEAMRNW